MTKHLRLLCSPSQTMFPPQKAQQNLCRGTVFNITRTFHLGTVLNCTRTSVPDTMLNITKTLYLGTITHFQVEYSHLLLVKRTISQFPGDMLHARTMTGPRNIFFFLIIGQTLYFNFQMRKHLQQLPMSVCWSVGPSVGHTFEIPFYQRPCCST